MTFNSSLEAVEGLVYSTYFENINNTTIEVLSFAPEIKPGVYYYLSDDGFNWSGNALYYLLKIILQNLIILGIVNLTGQLITQQL